MDNYAIFQTEPIERLGFIDPNRPIITPIEPSAMTFNGEVKILQYSRDL